MFFGNSTQKKFNSIKFSKKNKHYLDEFPADDDDASVSLGGRIRAKQYAARVVLDTTANGRKLKEFFDVRRSQTRVL